MSNNDFHKSTIKFQADNWVKLKNLAAIQNTSPTQILNQLLDSYVNDKLPENYETRIKDKVHEELDRRITDIFLDTIALKVAERLNLDSSTTSTTNATDIDNTENTIEVSATEENTTSTTSTTRKPKTSSTSNTSNTTKKAKSPSTTNTTKKIKRLGLEEIERREANLDKFKHYLASDRKPTYKDIMVAAKEKLNKETIRRYRTGERTPKPEFIKKWGLNWNNTEWIEN